MKRKVVNERSPVKADSIKGVPCKDGNIFFLSTAFGRKEPFIGANPVGDGGKPGKPPEGGRIIGDGNAGALCIEMTP